MSSQLKQSSIEPEEHLLDSIPDLRDGKSKTKRWLKFNCPPSSSHNYHSLYDDPTKGTPEFDEQSKAMMPVMQGHDVSSRMKRMNQIKIAHIKIKCSSLEKQVNEQEC